MRVSGYFAHLYYDLSIYLSISTLRKLITNIDIDGDGKIDIRLVDVFHKRFRRIQTRKKLRNYVFAVYLTSVGIISINLLPDNLRLHFIFSFLLFFALKLPISNFKKWSLILVYHSDLIQFKENYLLCFQGCVFSIQKKYKSHFLFSRYSKSCGEGKAKQKTCLSERI